MGGSANGAFWAKINSVSTTIQPSAGTPLPDLQITAITFNPASPTHGVPAHISITIYNAGSAATNGSFTVKWWGLESYAQPSCAWVVNDVLVDHGGKVVNCDYIYPNPYAPNLLSKAQVDTENNITENDEGNNGLKVPVTVQ